MYSHSDYDPFLGFVEVTESEVNRGAGYGLEIPCINRLYGPKPYTDSTKASKVQTLGVLKHCCVCARLNARKCIYM